MGQVTDADIRHYEGLVRATAGRYEKRLSGGAMDFEDICAVLRIKIWKALADYDPAKKPNRDKYVFMCLTNHVKDLLKIKSRHPEALYVEDVAPTVNGNGAIRDAFELRYLSADEDNAFMAVLDEPPNLPNTLTQNERHVLVLMYHEYKLVEIGPVLGLSLSQVKSCAKGLREKMADWEPSAPQQPVAA